VTGAGPLIPIGVVASQLRALADAPRQPDEGAPEAWLRIDPAYVAALDGVSAGMRIVVVTWLHQADRGVQTVHPRGDPAVPLAGVFATRSPDRPNPIGLHTVTVLDRAGCDVHVDALEVIDGTPVLDIKCVI
jgi:tRNA-Thr(GGU) m(6)t(6)A37 methyltransferase TsaA